MTFVKLHEEILDSSVWSQPHATRIVWITMLAMADQDGVVRASVGGLAHRARVTEDECRSALACFLGPDPDSRDRTTGERIEELPGGWLILNHDNYRERQTREQVLAAARVARHRATKRLGLEPVTLGNAVTPGNATSPSEAEAEADTEAEKKKQKRAVARPASVSEEVWQAFLAVRKSKRAVLTEIALAAIQREAVKAGMTLEAALQKCAERNWQSFEAAWVKVGRNGKPSSPAEHPRNTPLGSPSCQCEGCVKARTKMKEEQQA